MKHIIVLGDGMADMPIKELSNMTPLQKANKPNIDILAKNGEIGLVKTVPDNIFPGSDVANLSVLGFDPLIYSTGRSPLEAVSMGINMSSTDVALRCNLVTLSEDEDYENKIILDHSSDEISTEEAKELINYISPVLSNESLKFYPGISYRHCMIWSNGETGLNLTPPHNIIGQKITNYLPNSDNNSFILDLMKKSYDLLKVHPVNLKRKSQGLRPANSIWIWGEGKKPSLPTFKDTYGKNGSMISAVDLLKGIGIFLGLNVVEVPGATGTIHTNFSGKAQAAIKELENGKDFVFLHLEAPDECGHRGEIENKVKSIELIDEKIVGYLLNELDKFGEYRIMVLPDHPTPLSIRTHTSDPVPYVIYSNYNKKSGSNSYDEHTASLTGNFFQSGPDLLKEFLFNT